MKKIAKLEIVDIAYIVFFSLFSLLAMIELIKYILAEYSFVRACIVFAVVTFGYVAFKNDIFSRNNRKKGSTRKKISSSGLGDVGAKRKTLKKQVASWISTEYLSLGFILYALFVLAYMITDISEQVFFYVSLAFILYYLLFRFSGLKIDTSFPKTPFSQMTFLKLGVLSFSLFFILLLNIFPKELVGENAPLVYLGVSFIYVIGFTFLFSRIFHNFYTYIVSRKFKLWILSHTYFLLSAVIFFISFLLIAGNYGLFDSLFVKKVVPEVYSPPVIEEPTVSEYQEVSEIRPLVEFYNIQAPLTPGDSGEEVTKLQNALVLIGNYTQPVTGEYDEYTRTTLRDVLIEKCDWPESTQGIVGPQAKACLDSIEVERTIRIDTSGFEGEIISNEALTQ